MIRYNIENASIGGNMEYTMTDDPRQEDIDVVLDKLKNFNLSHIELAEVKPLAIFVKDEKDAIIGGISAETHGNWLKVFYLCLDENIREQKIGTKLLQDAETEAIARGCRYSFLDTFGFQARDFYEKAGYREVFTLEDYPVFGKRHYMVKQLAEDV